MSKGLLVIYSGPSGCGKGTVLKKVLERRPEAMLSVSVTTRAPRTGERDGVEYFFRTREEFERMLREDAFLEHAEYAGNCYGTPKRWVEEQREAGRTVFLEIEVHGGCAVMDRCPEAVSVFLEPPSLEELEHRLRGRGTEDEAVIGRRMDAARWELEQKRRYRYHIINDTPEAAAERICAILDAEAAARD